MQWLRLKRVFRPSLAYGIAACAFLIAGLLAENQPRHLTLHEAEQIALANSPRIGAAHFTARAAAEVTKEQRAAYYPAMYGSFTGAGAAEGTRIAAGGLNNPVIYNRLASGITVGQTLFDWGRTSNLVESADMRAKAQEENVVTSKADAVLDVDRAYYAVLRAQEVLKVAQQTVSARQLVTDQVTTLAQSKLKSNLDVSFANTNLAEAKLLLANARNELQAAEAQLESAMGFTSPEQFVLEDEPLPPVLNDTEDALVQHAVRNRPELKSLRLEESAAQYTVKAERSLLFPSVSAISSLGVVPDHQDGIGGRYGAVGLNLNIPIFNGRLYQARKSEAEFRDLATKKNLQDLETRIVRDVRLAYLNVTTSYDRMALTAQLLDSTKMALELAQERYSLGLSSIVELSQAQLNLTSAQISNVNARYDYQALRAILDYQTGVVR